jgi:hypothetical protein
MPLERSSSGAAFKANIRKEVEAGKPIKQAVAISYAVKRKAAHAPVKTRTMPAHERIAREHHRNNGY